VNFSRRGFLGLLGGLAAAPIVEPIARTFFLPPAGGWVPTASGLVVPGSQLLTVETISLETLRILQRNLNWTSNLNREFEHDFGVAGAAIGNTFNIRTPTHYADLGRA
jgi:hypothetical protein